MKIRPEEFEYFYFTDKDGNKITASEASNDPDAMYVEDDALSNGALVFKKDICPGNSAVTKLAAMNRRIRRKLWEKEPTAFTYLLDHQLFEHDDCWLETNKNAQDTIINMVISGDFTLREAIYIFKHACFRCQSALMYKYNRGKGHSEDSEWYKKKQCRCMFCEGGEGGVADSETGGEQ